MQGTALVLLMFLLEVMAIPISPGAPPFSETVPGLPQYTDSFQSAQGRPQEEPMPFDLTTLLLNANMNGTLQLPARPEYTDNLLDVMQNGLGDEHNYRYSPPYVDDEVRGGVLLSHLPVTTPESATDNAVVLGKWTVLPKGFQPGKYITTDVTNPSTYSVSYVDGPDDATTEMGGDVTTNRNHMVVTSQTSSSNVAFSTGAGKRYEVPLSTVQTTPMVPSITMQRKPPGIGSTYPWEFPGWNTELTTILSPNEFVTVTPFTAPAFTMPPRTKASVTKTVAVTATTGTQIPVTHRSSIFTTFTAPPATTTKKRTTTTPTTPTTTTKRPTVTTTPTTTTKRPTVTTTPTTQTTTTTTTTTKRPTTTTFTTTKRPTTTTFTTTRPTTTTLITTRPTTVSTTKRPQTTTTPTTTTTLQTTTRRPTTTTTITTTTQRPTVKTPTTLPPSKIPTTTEDTKAIFGSLFPGWDPTNDATKSTVKATTSNMSPSLIPGIWDSTTEQGNKHYLPTIHQIMTSGKSSVSYITPRPIQEITSNETPVTAPAVEVTHRPPPTPRPTPPHTPSHTHQHTPQPATSEESFLESLQKLLNIPVGSQDGVKSDQSAERELFQLLQAVTDGGSLEKGSSEEIDSTELNWGESLLVSLLRGSLDQVANETLLKVAPATRSPKTTMRTSTPAATTTTSTTTTTRPPTTTTQATADPLLHLKLNNLLDEINSLKHLITLAPSTAAAVLTTTTQAPLENRIKNVLKELERMMIMPLTSTEPSTTTTTTTELALYSQLKTLLSEMDTVLSLAQSNATSSTSSSTTTTTTTTTTRKPTTTTTTRKPMTTITTSTQNPVFNDLLKLFEAVQETPSKSTPTTTTTTSTAQSTTQADLMAELLKQIGFLGDPSVLVSAEHPKPPPPPPDVSSEEDTAVKELDILSKLIQDLQQPPATTKDKKAHNQKDQSVDFLSELLHQTDLSESTTKNSAQLNHQLLKLFEDPISMQLMSALLSAPGGGQAKPQAPSLDNHQSDTSFLTQLLRPPQSGGSSKPSGLYYWVDWNSYFGPKDDSLMSFRPKLGDRTHFSAYK